MANDPSHNALIVDFGGVLTTDIWSAFASFCEIEKLDPGLIKDLFRGDPQALTLLRGLETGEIEDADFESRFGGLIGVADTDGLITRLFAGLKPDERMVAAVVKAGEGGLKTGLLSNSWGTGIYDRAPLQMFDAVVISGDVGLHKPQPEIYRLVCERLGIEPGEAVFVDDLRENCDGAEAVGMAAVLHRGADKTVPRLESLLGVSLT